MAERKVEVEINGKRFRVAEHLVSDMLKFGATLTKREIKNPPKELLNMPPPKKVILPGVPGKVPAPVKEEIVEPKEIILPEAKSPDLKLPVKKTRTRKK